MYFLSVATRSGLWWIINYANSWKPFRMTSFLWRGCFGIHNYVCAFSSRYRFTKIEFRSPTQRNGFLKCIHVLNLRKRKFTFQLCWVTVNRISSGDYWLILVYCHRLLIWPWEKGTFIETQPWCVERHVVDCFVNNVDGKRWVSFLLLHDMSLDVMPAALLIRDENLLPENFQDKK